MTDRSQGRETLGRRVCTVRIMSWENGCHRGKALGTLLSRWATCAVAHTSMPEAFLKGEKKSDRHGASGLRPACCQPSRAPSQPGPGCARTGAAAPSLPVTHLHPSRCEHHEGRRRLWKVRRSQESSPSSTLEFDSASDPPQCGLAKAHIDKSRKWDGAGEEGLGTSEDGAGEEDLGVHEEALALAASPHISAAFQTKHLFPILVVQGSRWASSCPQLVSPGRAPCAPRSGTRRQDRPLWGTVSSRRGQS